MSNLFPHINSSYTFSSDYNHSPSMEINATIDDGLI